MTELVEAYLERVAYHERPQVDLATLRALHRAHLLAIPFENLDIVRGVPFGIEEAEIIDKLVTRRRGGFCYEQNGLFALVLEKIGFTVFRMAASMGTSEVPTPPLDHLCLRVEIEGRSYLADVGSGASFVDPLAMDSADAQVSAGIAYRVRPVRDELWHCEYQVGEDWQLKYAFTLEDRPLSDFVSGCVYQQTSPDSHFTQRRVCSRATFEDGVWGRISLSDAKLVITQGSDKQEIPIESDAQFWQWVERYFGMRF